MAKIRKLPIYASFIAASLIEVVLFLTARTYLQLAIATAIYPLLVYFAFKLFSKKKLIPVKGLEINFQKPKVVVQPAASRPRGEGVEIVDIEKRAFLKLIGAAGLSFFVFSLFVRRAENLLFGRVTDSGLNMLRSDTGAGIESTEPQPLEGYQIAEVDEDDFTYLGFIDKDGNWFIMREDPENGSFRYARGNSNFPQNWANRKKLKYDYFSKVFP